MILLDNGFSGKFRHTHNAVCIVHSVFLYRIDRRIYLASRAVEVGRMHVNAQRFARYLLGVNTCWEGKPVVCVDNIVFHGTCNHTCYNGIVVYFFVQIGRIATCKLHRTNITHVHIAEIGVDIITQLII